jgi:hypothetical protein
MAQDVDSVLLEVRGVQVTSFSLFVTKGLCCKKEVPKIELALEGTVGLVCARVLPKHKLVVVFATRTETGEAARVGLKKAGFVLREEEENMPRKFLSLVSEPLH